MEKFSLKLQYKKCSWET